MTHRRVRRLEARTRPSTSHNSHGRPIDHVTKFPRRDQLHELKIVVLAFEPEGKSVFSVNPDRIEPRPARTPLGLDPLRPVLDIQNLGAEVRRVPVEWAVEPEVERARNGTATKHALNLVYAPTAGILERARGATSARRHLGNNRTGIYRPRSEAPYLACRLMERGTDVFRFEELRRCSEDCSSGIGMVMFCRNVHPDDRITRINWTFPQKHGAAQPRVKPEP